MELFLEEWISHPEYWFSGNDTFITNKYAYLLTTQQWDEENTSIRYHLSFLILYDQLPRHMYRNADPDNIIGIYLEKALFLYNFIYKNAKLNTNDLTPVEWCFFSLPVRHNKVPAEIIQVIRDTWFRVIKTTSDPSQYIRFLKSTYHRLNINEADYLEYSDSEYKVTSFVDYIDILSNCPFSLKTTLSEDTEIYKTIENFVLKHNLDDIIISLSGGVDSMVCSVILKNLQEKYQFSLRAVHIDYDNRSYNEFEFVKDWCAFIKIPLYTRHITEINRKNCMEYGMRKTYEDYTKKVRFGSYKAISTFPKVIMGHNYDDCFENILTNISNKDKYDNLKGMCEDQYVDGIHFLRPMLNIKKKDIYLFAYNNNVPYLHDSTPEWSQRGKIRDAIMPAFNKWNKDAIPGFFELSETLQEYDKIVSKLVDGAFTNDKNVIKVPCSELILSKLVWRRLFDNMSVYLSQKSLANFISKLTHTYYDLKYQKNKKQKAILNKKTTVQYSIGDGLLTLRII